MELKTYQKNVIGDLSRFLTLLTETKSIRKAYRTLWEEKGVPVNTADGMPPYHNNQQQTKTGGYIKWQTKRNVLLSKTALR